MKHKFLKKLALAIVMTATVIALAPISATAAWVENYGVWSYTEGYSYATGWRLINGTWYYFDSYGQMRTGWVQSNDEWYYMDSSGAMQTGVIQIEGKIHMFDQTGAMQKGFTVINGKLYNLDDNGVFVGTDVPMPSRAYDYYGISTVPYVPSQIIDESGKMSKDIPSDGKDPVIEYKIKFKDPDVEDNDGLIKTRVVKEDTRMLLYKPVKSGYRFIEWNTKSGGSGDSYEYDETIKVTKDMTLYAIWEVDDSEEEDETIKVEEIVVTGTNSIKKITAAGGSLQMTKKVYPSDATDQSVTWSVSNDTGEAYISTTGKLTALADGFVTVKATAKDGSGVVGEVQIEISNQ